MHGRLYSHAIKLLGSSTDAEDAVQAVYLKLWERRDRLHEVNDKWAYCSAMLTNICNDYWRRNPARATEIEVEEDIPDADSESYEYTDFEEFTRLYIERLPDMQRRVMTMRMEGATTEEIRKITGLSATNIRTILSRVRIRLKKFYK